jgi:hypothetical protein
MFNAGITAKKVPRRNPGETRCPETPFSALILYGAFYGTTGEHGPKRAGVTEKKRQQVSWLLGARGSGVDRGAV